MAVLVIALAAWVPMAYAAADCRYIAHRGRISTSQPENQLSTFKAAAADRNVYGIETDVWRTKDGRYVCIHGKGGTSAVWGGKEVTTTAYAALRSLHPNGGTLCTLGQYLDACKPGGKKAVIELKDKRFSTNKAFVRGLVRVCKNHDMLKDCIFISFQPGAVSSAVKYARTKYKVRAQGYVLAGNSAKSVDKALVAAKKHGLAGISVNKAQLAYASKVKGKYKVCAWTYTSRNLAASDQKAFAPTTITGEFKP